MAAETTQQDFSRLTLSPTIREHQLRLPRIVTRPSPPHSSVENPRDFVDELYEFPEPHPPIISITELQGCFKNQFPEHPLHPKAPASTASGVLTPCNGPSKKRQLAGASKPGGCSFEGRFHDLPLPIRMRLVKACQSAMRELVADVEKEMKGSSAGTTVPEDVRVWKDVVAAAETVGLDVDEPKQELNNSIRLLSSHPGPAHYSTVHY